MPPLLLSDSQMDAVMNAAAPIETRFRDPFGAGRKAWH